MSRANAKQGRSDGGPASGVRPVTKVRGLDPGVAEELDRLEKGLLQARRAMSHLFFCIPIGGRSEASYEYEDANAALNETDGALDLLRYELERRAVAQ